MPPRSCRAFTGSHSDPGGVRWGQTPATTALVGFSAPVAPASLARRGRSGKGLLREPSVPR